MLVFPGLSKIAGFAQNGRAARTPERSVFHENAVRISQKFEVHRVAQLRVLPEPIEAVAFERRDPAARELRALVHRFRVALAGGMIGPRRNAAAARVAIGVDVDGDAEEVVRDLAAAVAVRVAEAAERVRAILVLALPA